MEILTENEKERKKKEMENGERNVYKTNAADAPNSVNQST